MFHNSFVTIEKRIMLALDVGKTQLDESKSKYVFIITKCMMKHT